MNMNLTLLLALATATSAAAQGQLFGAVYTMTNDPSGNAVTVTMRLPNGGLLPFAEFSAAGTGTGMGLGSQGAIAASENGRILLAVNPGSNEVTLFRVFAGLFLSRQDTESSGGVRPTSVALHGNLVYVLNAGSDTIVGFRRQNGDLVAIPGATYSLSQPASAAAQVGFSPDGGFVVVTERATNKIGVFAVQPNGTLGAGNFQPSAGATPFGFLFRDDGTLVVSEAAGGAAGASVASSYRIQPSGTLTTITSAAPTNQSAACWIAIPRNGAFAYTTNTGSGTLTGYALNAAGALSPLTPSGITGDLGSAARPLDFEFDPSGRFLFVLDSAADRIETFFRLQNGDLLRLQSARNLGDGAAGLIVR
jgi:6-phosphogluconolactonase (cycloisomerase 2 family)